MECAMPRGLVAGGQRITAGSFSEATLHPDPREGVTVKRRAFTVASAVSLLLFLVSALVWVSTVRLLVSDPTMPSPNLYVLSSKPWTGWVSLLLLVATVILLAMRRKLPTVLEERRARGSCLRCGYDLRATPNHCPECGAAVPEETGKTA